jgi:hypothetical protein
MTMPALHKTACRPRRNRLRLAFAVIAMSSAVAACGDDASSEAASQEHSQQTQQAQSPTLATTFNAVPTLQTPQSSSAQAHAAASSGASAADSVVLAPPVIHTVD